MGWSSKNPWLFKGATLDATPLLLLVKSFRAAPLSVTVTLPLGQGIVLIGGMVPLLKFVEQEVPEELVTFTRMM
jgi:hypothetical protein